MFFIMYVVFIANVWLYLFSCDGSIPGATGPQTVLYSVCVCVGVRFCYWIPLVSVWCQRSFTRRISALKREKMTASKSNAWILTNGFVLIWDIFLYWKLTWQWNVGALIYNQQFAVNGSISKTLRVSMLFGCCLPWYDAFQTVELDSTAIEITE